MHFIFLAALNRIISSGIAEQIFTLYLQCVMNIIPIFISVPFAKELSYLDPLQSGGSLGNILWHIETFGGTDLGVDQPLLEISQGCTEPLLQQALLVLTLSGCTKTETGEQETKHEFSKLFSKPLPLRTIAVNRGFSE